MWTASLVAFHLLFALTTASPDGDAGLAAAAAASDSEVCRELRELVALEEILPAEVVADPAGFRVQVLVSRLEGGDGAWSLAERWCWRVDEEYIYPASALKFLAVVAGLQLLSDAGVPEDVWERGVLLASRESEGTRLLELVEQTLVVSSNSAFNSFYDLLGHRELNERLWSWGLADARMQHRLSSFEEEEAYLHSPATRLVDEGGRTHWQVGERSSSLRFSDCPMVRAQVGTAYRDPQTGERVDAPMDFCSKNYVPLSELHEALIALVAPSAVQDVRIVLPDAWRELVVETMTRGPGGSGGENFAFREDRYKPMLPGLRRVLSEGAVPRERLRYINKAGRAYGFHLDNAWLQLYNDEAWVVSAGIYVNHNGVLNDDHYEYATISYPFFQALGEAVGRRVLRPAVP